MSEITVHNGRYRRAADGIWRYADTGLAVPGATDMTISTLYSLPVYADHVIVPRHLARNEPTLAWTLAYEDTDATVLDRGRQRGMGQDPNIPDDAILVPLPEWDERAHEVIGMWAPELSDDPPTRQVAEAQREFAAAARRLDEELAQRRAEIAAERREAFRRSGLSLRQIAHATGLSHGRVKQILDEGA